MLLSNFLPETYITEIENVLNSLTFPWYYGDNTYASLKDMSNEQMLSSGVVTDDNTKECPMFAHTFFRMDAGGFCSQQAEIVKPMLLFFEKETGIKPKQVSRIKANLLIKQYNFLETEYNTTHADVNTSYPNTFKTLLYYVNDSDGDTVLFNEHLNDLPNISKLSIASRQKPVKGSAILFDSKQLHASTPPKNNNKRMVINYVFSI